MTALLLLATETTSADRAWLVNYCTRLCGDRTQAEDLAQETLLAAWQSAQRNSDAAALERGWLAGIARNMFRRWARRMGQEQQRWLPLAEADALALAEDALTYDLERRELADLLDRALARLPAPTRAALIAHYIEEEPQAAIATRLGLSAGALAVRLHRGRLALARLLATDLADAAEAQGIALPQKTDWETTRLWCPNCGRRHLEGQLQRTPGILRLRCPACGDLLHHGVAVGALKTYGAALHRVVRWSADYYLPAAAAGAASCFVCGRTVPLTIQTENAPEVGQALPLLVAHCPCQVINTCSMRFMALLTPAGQAFLATHRRIHFVRLEEGEVTDTLTFASVTSADHFVTRFARTTLQVLP